MLKLQRAIRYKDEIELPNGEVIAVDFNAEARAIEYIRAQNELIKVWQRCKDRTMTDAERDEYQRAYYALIEVILGDVLARRMLHVVEGNREELIGLLDFWIAEHIQPLILRASARIRERKKAEYFADRAK